MCSLDAIQSSLVSNESFKYVKTIHLADDRLLEINLMALNDAYDRLAVCQYNTLDVYDLTTVTATTNIVSSNKWTLLYSVLLDKAVNFINGLVWTSSDDIVYATMAAVGVQPAHVALVLMHGALRGSIDWQKRVNPTCMTRLDLLL